MKNISRINRICAAWLGCFFFCGGFGLLSAIAAESPKNLALDAKATASESMNDLTPEKANNGRMDTPLVRHLGTQ